MKENYENFVEGIKIDRLVPKNQIERFRTVEKSLMDMLSL